MPTLYPYQVEGASFLAHQPTALLADDMGLGKSAQAITAAAAVGAKHIGVVCPASLRENWRREFNLFWMVEQGADFRMPMVYIESYDKIIRGAWENLARLDVLILDEAHYLKTKDTKRTLAVLGKKGLLHLLKPKHVWCLTGTPTPNHPAELWPILYNLAPETIQIESKKPKPMAYWTFVNKYCKTVDNGFGTQIVGGKNMETLREKIAPFVLRRKKADVLKDLPGLRVSELPLYDKGALAALKKQIPEEELLSVVAALEDHGADGLARIAPHVATLRRVTGMAKVAVCAEWAKDYLSQTRKKIVIFAHHKMVLDVLQEEFGIEAVRLDGSCTPEQRQSAVDKFQTNPLCRVFLGQLQAAGVGITLTAAEVCLIVEPSWVPSENEQAIMRIHRIGQENHCFAYFACLADSIDEKIVKVAARKADDIARLFD